MYVYVLREEVPYEEHDWMEIVKDDEFAIYKIKKILIENVYADIAKNKTILKSLEKDSKNIPYALSSDFECRKSKAEDTFEKLEQCISKIGDVKNADEFGFYNKQYNTLSVEKVKVI